MGKGKLVKFADLETYSHVIQVTYRALDNEDFQLKGKWAKEFFKNENPIILELGCGKGEYTVQLAKKFPDKNYIGVDIKGARIWKGAKEVHELGLKNVAFIRTNIEIVNLFFGENEVDEIWLTFPDPQMKKTRKRLTATNFIENYKNFLANNGTIHLKTDSNFQFHYTCAMVEANNFEVLAKMDDIYNSDNISEILQIKTFYEKQWLDRGISIKYLAFKINGDQELIEPDIDIEKDAYRSFGRSAIDFSGDE